MFVCFELISSLIDKTSSVYFQAGVKWFLNGFYVVCITEHYNEYLKIRPDLKQGYLVHN